ncbi:MAG: hypothetical protein ACLUI3_17180 [Christensenellales bacterium]
MAVLKLDEDKKYTRWAAPTVKPEKVKIYVPSALPQQMQAAFFIPARAEGLILTPDASCPHPESAPCAVAVSGHGLLEAARCHWSDGPTDFAEIDRALM